MFDGNISVKHVSLLSDRVPVWQVFDREWYLARYPDAAIALSITDTNAAEHHYREHGARLGHSPNMFFDEVWYLSRYPGVAAHVTAGGASSGFDHYCNDGYRQGYSPHWLFDEAFYLATHREITQGLLDRHGFVNGYDHYLSQGDRDILSGHRFFEAALYQQNAVEDETDRSLSGGPFARFLADGARAGSTARLSWYFDPTWYLATYPDVAQEIDQGLWTCALQHYLCNGSPRSYAALEWFSESFYGKTYPDVLDAILDGSFRNTYEHFVRFGAAECRKPHEDVDLVRYAESARVQAELERRDYPDAFTHWLANAAGPAADDSTAAKSLPEAQSKELFRRQAEAMLPQFAHARIDFSVAARHDIGPAVSVIMILHNQFALTMTALASLRACFGGGIELILIDSGSRDEIRRIARYVSGARIVRFEHNVGFLEACNAALAHATAPSVLYLNNDLTLGIRSVELALARLASDLRIGAVGAKLVRTDGRLQEAGSIIWRDGATAGYLRDGDPNLPEANFVRDVDFCSGAFLMVRTDVLKSLGGFDDDFRPAYYEETDLCVRLKKAGYRVVYDPSVIVQHVEYGSAGTATSARMIERNHKVFAGKHQDWLRYKYPQSSRNAVLARSPKPSRGCSRILFIEDRIPMRDLGSGYVRSNDIVYAMAALGHHVSVYPIYPAARSVLETLADFPETAEVLYDRGLSQLPAFIAERAGYYDIVWIGRTHNLERLLPILGDASSSLPEHGFILDTEAVSTPRTIEQARVLGRLLDQDLETMLRRELACAYFCQKIIAVNERDAALIRLAGHDNVSVLGHMKEAAPTQSGWGERTGILFLGAVHEESSPNYDSLVWFVGQVLPLLDSRLSANIRFTIAGYTARQVDMSQFGRDLRIDLLGPVEDLEILYNSHRVFVAPTRFAGGIPFKVHEAASFGLPVVATELLCRQVGWTDGADILSGGTDDAQRFADRIMEAYDDEEVWTRIRNGALTRIADENNRAAYHARLRDILADTNSQ